MRCDHEPLGPLEPAEIGKGPDALKTDINVVEEDVPALDRGLHARDQEDPSLPSIGLELPVEGDDVVVRDTQDVVAGPGRPVDQASGVVRDKRLHFPGMEMEISPECHASFFQFCLSAHRARPLDALVEILTSLPSPQSPSARRQIVVSSVNASISKLLLTRSTPTSLSLGSGISVADQGQRGDAVPPNTDPLRGGHTKPRRHGAGEPESGGLREGGHDVLRTHNSLDQPFPHRVQSPTPLITPVREQILRPRDRATGERNWEWH